MNTEWLWHSRELGFFTTKMTETELISEIKRKCESVSASHFDITIGDDCAVRKEILAGSRLVLSSDISIESVHFSQDYMTLAEIGYKSAITNISDIAAMGATPDFMLVSLAFPKSLTPEEILEIYDGIISASREYNTPVVGGDLSADDKIIISITIGGIANGRVLTRSGAKVGDNIWVSGNSGNSAAGLELLQNYGRKKAQSLDEKLVFEHIKPKAQINLGKYLQNNELVNSCIDISDGLAKEIREICHKSGVGAALENISNLTSNILHFFNGGEDYELLFTADKYFIPEFEDTKFTKIGRITSEKEIYFLENGTRKPFDFSGFEHF